MLAANPAQAEREQGEAFTDFLLRVLSNGAVITTPEDVAQTLARNAREARRRIAQSDLPALTQVREALEGTLGVTFEAERGDAFFRSTLIQTLFYGVFSAWVLWSRRYAPTDTARFDWRTAVWELQVPMIRALFERVAIPTHLTQLDLVQVLDWTNEVLNRVDRASFFEKFEGGNAVQYFYEPFLAAFDPELRRELGVWYTPQEVVRYQVERVDAVLRDELGIAKGLADERVVVLDPCCGTGAYLVEVTRRIHQTLTTDGDALALADVKTAVKERVFGFELLPAPYVVAHLQMGLLLSSFGIPFEAQTERAAVYLTNALTGWAAAGSSTSAFPDFVAEQEAAGAVKRDRKVLVVLGNPPYNSFAGIATGAEERELSEAYRTTVHAPAPVGQSLNDLYVRFFRMAERRIVERTGQGVVCFISNYSWLNGLSFTGMREKYAAVFDRIWIDNLHGDRIISEYAPDGSTSETVFAVRGSSVGIKVGTAIATLVLRPPALRVPGDRKILYRDWDDARANVRRAALLESLTETNRDANYTLLLPQVELGLPFKPLTAGVDYLTWPKLVDLFPKSFPGIKTSRDALVVDIDRERLVSRMTQYFDPAIGHATMKEIAPAALESTTEFNAEQTRDTLRSRGIKADNFVRYAYRPFDTRYLYWEPETKLLDRNRTEYIPHVFPGNLWVEARQRNATALFDRGMVTHSLGDNIGNGLSNYFPLLLRATDVDANDPNVLMGTLPETRFNLSGAAKTYLALLTLPTEPTPLLALAEALFYHTLAILHAPAYREANDGALRQDWPRIPLPASADALLASATLGRLVAALLDTETPFDSVTHGSIRPEIARIAQITKAGGVALNPATGDLAVTVNWGYLANGAVMPGSGKIIARDFTAEEAQAFAGIENVETYLGASTVDVYLNDQVYWRNVPVAVWKYSLGGYQVLKKWLSYRQKGVLQRDLTIAEVREVTGIARRIALLLLLSGELNANYTAVALSAAAWP